MIERVLARGPVGSTTPAGPVYALGLVAALKAAGLVLAAEAVARAIATLADGSVPAAAVLWGGLAGVLLRALAAWLQPGISLRLAGGVKERLRREALDRVLGDSATDRNTGGLSVLLTRGLDGLDKYYTQYLPALVTCAVVPLMVGARILAADWVSAVIIVFTIPLVPLFMVLIGWHTQDRTREARESLDRLSNHLLELAKGLPALVGLGRASAQTRALGEISGQYSQRTMETLRVAFLSSLALELISTISVAVVAVFVGIRLIHGEVGLEVGLLALILAPECYLPLRDVGAAHHASEEGLDVGRQVRGLLDAPRGKGTPAARMQGAPAAYGQNLTIRYAGSREPVVKGLDFTLEPGAITAIRGASGSGKSTLMSLLAGNPNPQIEVTGVVVPLEGPIAWVPQHPELLLDTVRAELAFYAGNDDDGALSAALADVGGAQLLGKLTGDLSPGELRRVAVARALLRLQSDGGTLLLDEPTAHVDEETSRTIQRAVGALRGQVTVVLIAHDETTAALADATIDLAPRALPSGVGGVGGGSGEKPLESSLPVIPSAAGQEPALPKPQPEPAPTPLPQRISSALALVRPWTPKFLAALAFGTGSSLFAVALTALSGWLIVRASEQPPILYLLAAIVGVRFFGIGRSLLRYCERLWLHDAVLETADVVRLRLWKSLLGRAGAWRSLSRGSGAIERLVGDIDELRESAARAVFPPLTALLTGAGAVLATAVLLPSAVGWQLVAVVAGVLAAPVAAVWAERSAGAAGVNARAALLAETASLVRAARDVSVNGLAARALDRVARVEQRSAGLMRKSSWAAGISQGVIVLGCAGSAIGILAGSGGLPAEAVAVVVLMQLALIEPFALGTAAVQQWGHLDAVARRLTPQLAEGGPADDDGNAAVNASEAPSRLALRNAAVGYEPERPVVQGMDLTVVPGQWTALTGPSGSGKSTVVGALLGFLPLIRGEYRLDGVPLTAGARPRIAWCPQEGYLFNSTIRANLQLARRPAEQATDAELWHVLAAVGLTGAVQRREGGLDAPIGAGGGKLSGGERQRLAVARALLADGEVLILDEPTAHLDTDGAELLMRDLRFGLAQRPVLLVTHDPVLARDCSNRVELATRGGISVPAG